MWKKIGLFLLTAFPAICFGQDYRASLIPDSLKQQADAVKRMEEMHVIIKGIDKAVIKRKYAITILNENGDNFAYYQNGYTDLISLSDISGRLMDADGKVIRTIRKKDISDVSGSDDASLLTDERIKKYSFYHRNYPYTVEFEDEREFKGIYFLPVWRPIEDEKFSVQQSRMTVEVPAGYELRYRQFNHLSQPVITGTTSKTYTWEIKDKGPILFESFQPDMEEIVPLVYLAPSEFSFGSYKGNMSTWKGLGEFITQLNRGRDILPNNVKNDIHQLSDAITDPAEKIKVLYRYLQKNTRYISIQLGIGGWQPFEAKYVAEKKYGDCKALSNYMVSILKEAGVKANYVLINSGTGRKGLTEDFPAPYYFNHAVCCVPNGKDTIWLECTSQTEPAGFMGSFTGDRKALLIRDDGGYVVNTPSYRIDDNQQLRKIVAVVDVQGNMTADVHTHFTGIQQELQHSLIYKATKEERTKYLNRALSLPTYVVERSEYNETPGPIPVVDEFLQVKASSYATVSGRRMFIVPNLFNRLTLKLDETERKYPIRFSMGYRDADTAIFTVPAGYSIESRPKDLIIENQFGKYNISYRINNNNIEVVRSQTSNRKTYPASDYTELVKYYQAIYKADHGRIVLVKAE